jgi:putative phage-type endonuclease
MPPLVDSSASSSLLYPSLPFTAPVTFEAPLVHDIAQRSAPWFALRVGNLTSSRSYAAHPRRDGDDRARRGLVWLLVQERLTGRPHESAFQSAPMRRGRELEATAREAYSQATGWRVRTTGFLAHPTLAAGTSLDGDVDDLRGVLEIKCPNTATHLWYRATGRIPADYRAQITHHLWITGAQWCDFVSYDNRVPAPLRLVRLRVLRDEQHLAWYDGVVRDVLAEVEAAVRVVGFFKAADLALAREVLAASTRALEFRGGITRRAA